VAKEHPQGFREGENKLAMRNTQQDFLSQMFGKEKCSLLAAGGTQIKPLTGEEAEVVISTVRVGAAYTRYPLQVIAAGEKVFVYFNDAV